jgi:hypothetical protein
MGEPTSIAAAAISLFGSIIVGLVVWGWKSELSTLRAEMLALKADMRASIAESVNSFYLQINGSYTKKDLHNTLVARVDSVENRVNELGD